MGKPRRRRGRGVDPATRTITRDESFRVLRSNLQVAIAELANPVVVVTSAYAGEGKTSLCVNLAESLATAGARVVLVDLDLRNPDSHRLLGAHNEVGVADILLDRRALEDCLQYVELPARDSHRPNGLYFLSTGADASNPAELLGTSRTGRLLDALARQADIVLLDTPPVLPVADTLVIGRLAAGAVLVVEARRTPIPAVERAKDSLARNQTRLLGVVLNKLQARDTGMSYGYGYGYGPSNSASRGPGRNGSGHNGTKTDQPTDDDLWSSEGTIDALDSIDGSSDGSPDGSTDREPPAAAGSHTETQTETHTTTLFRRWGRGKGRGDDVTPDEQGPADNGDWP